MSKKNVGKSTSVDERTVDQQLADAGTDEKLLEDVALEAQSIEARKEKLKEMEVESKRALSAMRDVSQAMSKLRTQYRDAKLQHDRARLTVLALRVDIANSAVKIEQMKEGK